MNRRSPSSLALILALTSFAPVASLTAPSLAVAQGVRAHGDPEAEAFVQTEASRVLEVLNDHSMPLETKKQTFRDLVNEVADVPRITNFVLGRYRRLLTPAQYDQFSEVFRTYATNVYESRLGQYRGQTLKVTGSAVRQPGDVVVASEITGAGQPTQVNWRVLRGADGRYKAVDVQVAGVWLAITEQQDFVSTLDNNHGDIGLLIRQLRTQPQPR